MLTCSACGANLPDGVPVCTYCGAMTPEGIRQKHAQDNIDAEHQQRRMDREDQRIDNARESLRKSSLHSLIWSLVGIALCCFPLSIVGLVMAIRARKMSRKYTLVLPATATIGLVISSVTLVGAVGLGIWFGIDTQAINAKKETLRMKVAEPAKAENLSAETACDLVYLDLLQNGYEETSEYGIEEPDCGGKIVQSGDKAELDSISFAGSGSKRFDVKACFMKGAKWHFRYLVQEGGSCE